MLQPHLVVSFASATVIAAVAMSGSAIAQQILLDDFASGTDVNWTRVDLLNANNLGPTVYDASSNRYQISSTAALPTLPVVVASLSSFTISSLDPKFANGILRVTVRFDNPSTNLGLFLRGDTARIDSYTFSCNNFENAIFIDRAVGGRTTSGGIGGVTNAPFQFQENTDYIVEAAVLDSELTMKVWEQGTTPPYSPQLRVVDHAYSTGAIGVFIYNQPSGGGGSGGKLSAQFDDVLFTPCGTNMTYGNACLGFGGRPPDFRIVGCATGGQSIRLSLRNSVPNGRAIILIGGSRASAPLGGGCELLIGSVLATLPISLSPIGGGAIPVAVPTGLTGSFTFQSFTLDPANVTGIAASRGIELDLK